MDLKLIEQTRDKILLLINGDIPDEKTRIKVKKLMEALLPEYKFKCDLENNPPDVMDSGNIKVTVYDDKNHLSCDVFF